MFAKTVSPSGWPSRCGHLFGIEQRAAARPAAVGSVGMPGEAGIGQADMLAGLVADIGNQQDLGKSGEQVLLDDMDFELSKARAELDMPLVRQLLVAKDDDDVVVKDAARSRGMSDRRCLARDRSRFPRRRPRRFSSPIAASSPLTAACSCNGTGPTRTSLYAFLKHARFDVLTVGWVKSRPADGAYSVDRAGSSNS